MGVKYEQEVVEGDVDMRRTAGEYFVEDFWALGYREDDVAKRVLWRSPASMGDALVANLSLTTATPVNSTS
jgi:hypothetical protein